jgi:hypothetical protein
MTGVSQATVSLVLNNRTGDDVRIAPETRQRVLDAIRATGYVADPVARRLVSGRNRILGVFTYEPVFPSTAADFYHPFLVGIEQRAEQLGCDLLLFTSSSQASGAGGAGGLSLGSAIGGGPSCDGGVGDAAIDAADAAPCDASSDVSYSATVAPILSGCTGELCHAAWTRTLLVGRRSKECCDGRFLVVPGDPAQSYVVDKIGDHDLCGASSPMPLGGPALSSGDIRAISDWICLGALED